MSITRGNHYVSAFLLRNWAGDDRKVLQYRILVSSPSVPLWQPKSTRSVASHDDLYTVFSDGREIDEFEKWCDQEFETPAAPSVQRVVSDSRVSADDWRRIIRLVALHDLRTPQGFLGLRTLWERIVPEILESTLKEAVTHLEEAHATGKKLVVPEGWNRLGRIVRVAVEPREERESDKARIRATVPAGRRLWLESVRNLMENCAKTLHRHKWTVAAPFGDREWPLPDHPVLRLNWNSEQDYNFDGGWNQPGTELMMPLSPRHLLYARVGHKWRSRFQFSERATELVQRLLAERAHRSLIARSPQDWVERVRPRVVDADAVKAEGRAWKEWHDDQLASETELDKPSQLTQASKAAT